MTVLSPLPIQKFFTNNGVPMAGGLLFTYAAGTTNKVTTWKDSAGSEENTNPIELDFRGECRLWIEQGTSYKYVLSPPDDTDPPTAPIWTEDDISIPNSGGSGSTIYAVRIDITDELPAIAGATANASDWTVDQLGTGQLRLTFGSGDFPNYCAVVTPEQSSTTVMYAAKIAVRASDQVDIYVFAKSNASSTSALGFPASLHFTLIPLETP